MKKSKQKRITGLSVLDRQLVLFPRRSIVVALVCLVAVYGVVHAAMQEIQFRHQKQQFAQVEQDMQKTYNQIVTSAGSPFETHKVPGCSYGSEKYGHGPLYCASGFVFTYESSDTMGSYSKTKSLYTMLLSKYRNNSTQSKVGDTATSPFTYGFSAYGDFSCSFEHHLIPAADYLNNPYGQGVITKNVRSAYADLYKFYCGSFPVKPVYQLQLAK